MTSPDTTQVAAGGGSAAASGSGAPSLVEQAIALQTVLTDLSTVTVAQLVALFRQNQGSPKLEQLLKTVLPQIVMPHASAAADVTAQWFNELDPTNSSLDATPTVKLPAQQLDKTIAWALWAPTEKQAPEDLLPQSPVSAPTMAPVDVALSRLAGSTKRMVFDASRDTVLANAQQQGWKWARYESANCCAFCRVMATKTNSSRLYNNTSGVKIDPDSGNYVLTVVGRGGRPRGTQPIGEKYHDGCRGIAIAVPDGQTYTAPDYTDQWSQDYKDAWNAVPDGTPHKKVLPMVLAHMRANTDAH